MVNPPTLDADYFLESEGEGRGVVYGELTQDWGRGGVGVSPMGSPVKAEKHTLLGDERHDYKFILSGYPTNKRATEPKTAQLAVVRRETCNVLYTGKSANPRAAPRSSNTSLPQVRAVEIPTKQRQIPTESRPNSRTLGRTDTHHLRV